MRNDNTAHVNQNTLTGYCQEDAYEREEIQQRVGYDSRINLPGSK